MPPLLKLQKLPGKGDRGWEKKSVCVFFLADQKIANSWKKNVFGGILWHEQQGTACCQQVIACCQTHSDYGPPKMPFKLAV